MIQSHCDPIRSLARHLADIREATDRILATLPPAIAADFRPLLDAVIRLHDVGKGTSYFQAYIKAPSSYPGRLKKKKAHAELGFLYAAHRAHTEGWSAYDTLCVTATVLRHHGKFPAVDDLEAAPYRNKALNDDQLNHLDHAGVASEIGEPLPAPSQIKADRVALSRHLNDAANWLLEDLSQQEAAQLRLRAQLLYSILLEADKAWLAIAEEDRLHFRQPDSCDLEANLIDQHLSDKPTSPLNTQRTAIRQEIARQASAGIATVTLPTGMGKTMAAAAWILENRRQAKAAGDPVPKTIIVLPFLSIIDQTVQEYEQLLQDTGLHPQQSHSLAPIPTEEEAGVTEERSIDFLLDTWQCPIVITTFDQFLYALFSPKGRHQIRYHNLVGAQIVIDEIQALPTQLWALVQLGLTHLTRDHHARLLVMSATQPGFLSAANELVTDPGSIFAQRRRYRIRLRHRDPIPLESLAEECIERAAEEWTGRKVLVVLNTRRTARELFEQLDEAGIHTRLISTELTPRDRLAHIREIQADDFAGIVVSTQCIEAGVDIDMDLVIRDLAPLDAVIQVAGRCNRNGLRDRADVELVQLLSDKDVRVASFVYDRVLLAATIEVLANHTEILEEDIFSVADAYFDLVRTRMNHGPQHAEAWARWQKPPKSIRQLLRGDREQVDLIVAEQDPGLCEDLVAANDIEGRWDRRRALKRLAPRIAQVTVSIYARPGQDPSGFARQIAGRNILNPGLYQADRGLDPRVLPEPESSIVF